VQLEELEALEVGRLNDRLCDYVHASTSQACDAAMFVIVTLRNACFALCTCCLAAQPHTRSTSQARHTVLVTTSSAAAPSPPPLTNVCYTLYMTLLLPLNLNKSTNPAGDLWC
jgi:hypothetical protein